MEIIQVNNRASEKAFLDLPRLLYRNDPNFVVPFDREVKSAFDRGSNPYFHHGDARRWIVRDHRKKVVGRIAAFYDKAKEEADEVKCGGCGYFECVDDLRVSGLLFDTARQWLEEQGFEGMDGPVNFGENDTNWGCLVHGFMPQGLGMTYNFPYYRNLFESYGFQLYYRQYSFHLDLTRPFPERFWKIAEWVHTRKDFNYKYVDLNHLDDFVRDFVLIYNQAWPGLRSDFTPMDPASLYDEFRKIKAILDPELIWFAYHGDEPIAFFMFLPDAHQIFRHLNGKLHLWNKLRFLRMKRQGIIDRARGTVAGVVPKYQRSGVESGIFFEMKKVMDHKPEYKEFELSWVGDFNPKMIALYQATGAVHAKTHHTYRCLFKPEKPYSRFMPDSGIIIL